MSTVTFTGNVGSVELQFTSSGKAVVDVSVAENHRRKDPNGQWVDDGVTWRRVSFWERKAEAVADEIQTGDMVIVTGDERLREYQAKDGSLGKSLEVSGREIGKLILPKRDGQQAGNAGQYSHAPQAAPATAWGAAPAGNDPWQGGGQQQGQGNTPPPF